MALKEEEEFAISGNQKDSVREETNASFRHESNDGAKPTLGATQYKNTRWKCVDV